MFFNYIYSKQIPCILPSLDINACVYEDIVKLNKYISRQSDRG